jgi:hypothetical protein
MLFAELGKSRSTCLQIPGTHNFQNLCLGTRSLGVRCLFTELGEADRSVCVSTFRSNSGLPVKSAEGRSINFVDLTTLAGSAVVPNADLHGMRHPSGLEGEPGASEVGQGGENTLCSVPGFRLVAWMLSGWATESRFFRSGGRAIRGENQSKYGQASAYDSAWRNWSDWCMGRGSDPMFNDLIMVTAFLAEQSRSK